MLILAAHFGWLWLHTSRNSRANPLAISARTAAHKKLAKNAAAEADVRFSRVMAI